jgi:hypothetical protein
MLFIAGSRGGSKLPSAIPARYDAPIAAFSPFMNTTEAAGSPINPFGAFPNEIDTVRFDMTARNSAAPEPSAVETSPGDRLLTVGKTIADAFLSTYTFENTCRIQIDAQAGGELIAVNPQIVSGVAQAMRVQTGGLGGAFAWPALLRKVQRDLPGWNT